MSENKTILLPEQMKALARYETTFSQIIPLPEGCEDIRDYVVPKEYQMTLEDLHAAIKNLMEKDLTMEEFGNDWYWPILDLDYAFGIDIACGDPEDRDCDREAEPGRVRGLPVTREDVFSDVWHKLVEDCLWLDEARVSERPTFQGYLDEIEQYFANSDKPICERFFTDEQKEEYLESFCTDSRIAFATELELQLCRQFTEEFCEKESATALEIKAYSSYRGNRLYVCDWFTARDCLIRLYELTEDPEHAISLGEIYYYGRCNGGVPEYEKAYEMIAIAATNGYYGGVCMLGDMFRYGYACKKSLKAARSMYGVLYEDCRRSFLANRENSFADAAFRMGNVFFEGIDAEVDYEEAYRRYLEAYYANTRITTESNDYGYLTDVNLREALDKTKAQLGEAFFREYVETDLAERLNLLLEDNNRIRIWTEKREDGETDLHIERSPVRTGKQVAPILLTEPRLDWCELITGLTLRLMAPDTSFTESEPITVDFVEWNDEELQTDLYFADRLVGWVFCEGCRLYGPKKEAPSGELLRLVAVRFFPQGRSYDYLCEDETVQVGDRVLVPSYPGASNAPEAVAEVWEVFTEYESEISQELDQYKRVIRKQD